MSLSELMSNMVVTVFPQIALVIFLITFTALMVEIFRRSRADIDHSAHLPLDDGHSTQSSGVTTEKLQ